MNLRITALLFAMAISQIAAVPQSDKDVEGLVRSYFSAFQKQEWEAVIEMMHPKSLQESRDKILKDVPELSSDIVESERAKLNELLGILGVKTPEEARKLPPKKVFLSILRSSTVSKATNALKDAKTEIKNVSVQRKGDEFHADVDAQSELRGKLFSGTTHFVVELFDGTLKVVAMTKTKQPPQDK